MTEEYVTYNGIPHKVLPKEQPTTTKKDTKSDLQKQLELQEAILNPQDAYYILGDRPTKQQTEEGKLIARSAASTEKKKFTAQDQLELVQMILG